MQCVKISPVSFGKLQFYKLSEGTGVRVSSDGSKRGGGADTQLDVTSRLWPLNWTNPFLQVIAAMQKYVSVLKGSQPRTQGNDEIAINMPERLWPLRRPHACIQGFPVTTQKCVHLPPILSI